MGGAKLAGSGKPDPDGGNSGGKCAESPETEHSGGVGEGSEQSECTRRPGDGCLGGTRTGRLLGTTYVRRSGAFIFEPGDTGGKLSPNDSGTEWENEPRQKESVGLGVGERLAQDEVVDGLHGVDVVEVVAGAGRRESTEQSTTKLYLWRKG